jgi:hypothetical protein
VTDGNLDKKTFAGIAGLCGTYNIPLVFEPTSVPKAVLPVSAGTLGALDIVKPNEKELVAVRPLGTVGCLSNIAGLSAFSWVLYRVAFVGRVRRWCKLATSRACSWRTSLKCRAR